MRLPEWMEEPSPVNSCPAGKAARGGHRYLSKGIRGMHKVLYEELATEHYAQRDGWWQKLDPRVKLVTVILLVIQASLTRNLWMLVVLWSFTAVAMWCSRLPVMALQKRVWGIIPLLTLLVALPGTLNLLVDGTPLFAVYHCSHPGTWLGIDFPSNVYITRQGLEAALFLFLRVGVCISLCTLLTLTTSVSSLLKSLRVLRVPALFVMIIEMSYRYVVLLISTSIEMLAARTVRTVGELSLRCKRELVISSIGALFARSMTLAEEVYMAMSARGYTGEPVCASEFKLGSRDIAWIAVLAVFFASVLTGGMMLG